MKILIQTGSQSFDLCKGADQSENVEHFAINGRELVQEPEGFLRATKTKTFARGNTKTRVRFTITKEHADFRTCEEYILDHHATIPKTGSVKFIAEGSGQTERTLSDASLVSHDRDHIGVTSIHTYEFTGGDFS